MKKTEKKSVKKPTVFKCKQCLGWIPVTDRDQHFCIKPTEAAVISNLEEEPKEAWFKLRAYADSLGPQRIYPSTKSVMFARSVCYMFVRPKKTKLEVCLFLPKKLKRSSFKDIRTYSKKKFAHFLFIHHEDQVEGELLQWINLAWDSAQT